MKISVIAFLSLFPVSGLFSQSDAGRGQNCEDLVFNTRELTQFAYNERCKSEAYPFLSHDGNHLYYTNDQNYKWLFHSRKDSLSGVWSVPVPLQIDNFNAPILSCYLTADLSLLYFTTGSSVYVCRSADGSKTHFTAPEQITVTGELNAKESEPFSFISFSEDMRVMYAYTSQRYNSDAAYKTMASYVRTTPLSYAFDRYVSENPREIGALGKGGLIYYFTHNTYRNMLFCRKRSDVNEDFGQTVYLVKAFEPNLNVTQLRISEGSGLMVMVLSESLWNKNDIYFLDQPVTDSVFGTEFSFSGPTASAVIVTENKPTLVYEKDAPAPLHKIELLGQTGKSMIRIELGNPFPNPARSNFYIYYRVSGENPEAPAPRLLLLDQSGKIVYTQVLDEMMGEVNVTPQQLASGAYYVRIDYNGLSSAMSRVNLSF